MLEDEIQELVNKRMGAGVKITLSDVWRIKKLQVRGEEGTL